jgi:hypothetical protein
MPLFSPHLITTPCQPPLSVGEGPNVPQLNSSIQPPHQIEHATKSNMPLFSPHLTTTPYQPPLSVGEGPNVPQLNSSIQPPHQIEHATKSNMPLFSPHLTTTPYQLPLPVGEGWGEGQRIYPTNRLVISSRVLTSCGRVSPLVESMMEL